ncbi:MAG: hypothetical protein ACI9MC_001016 [Kiritimatiellia bacterium]|jgi:hypothetical protein
MSAPHELPELDECGFVRVPNDGTELFMTCEQCKKSDHFWIEGSEVRCRCGARYDHALRPDGSQVGFDDLVLVPWKQGPMQLADTEVDPKRLVIVGAIALVLIASAVAGLAWTMGWLG